MSSSIVPRQMLHKDVLTCLKLSSKPSAATFRKIMLSSFTSLQHFNVFNIYFQFCKSASKKISVFIMYQILLCSSVKMRKRNLPSQWATPVCGTTT